MHLDVLDAGDGRHDWIPPEQELQTYVGPERGLATILSLLVDKDDPAFQNPTKFMGPYLYREKKLQSWACRQTGW
jgi:carbamate kinase